MKAITIFLAALIPLFSFGNDEKLIKSKINEVTIFTIGAQVSRDIKMTLVKGENTLAFEGLSPGLDEKSIQFFAEGDISILSLNYEIRYDEGTQARKLEAQTLSAKLKSLQEDIRTQNDLLVISKREEEVLLSNTDFDVWEGINTVELKQGLDLVRTRLTDIKQRQRKAKEQIDALNIERQKTLNRLSEMRIEDATPNGVLVVKVDAAAAVNSKGNISYVVADAGWEPYYDLRVEDISKPLKIEYKAKVYQKTGEDWDDVKITLSTGNPYESGRLPELDPWYLNFVNQGYYQQQTRPTTPQKGGVTGEFNGVVLDAKTAESIPFANVVLLDNNRRVISGATTDIDGKFKVSANSAVSLMEVSYVGYNKYTTGLNDRNRFQTIRLSESANQLEEVVITYEAPLMDREYTSEETMMERRDISMAPNSVNANGGTNIRGARGEVHFIDGVKVRGSADIPSTAKFQISQNPVNLKFDVKTPYDIPSDGEPYKVAITEYEKEADYLYKAVPKLNEHAFLTASITDWEELNLMNGSACIYFEGTYLGETALNPKEAGDTLSISLGKDENIIVLREAVVSKEGSRVWSNRKEEKFHYEIKVRNNKTASLNLEIMDQFPISGNDEITVERVESSEGVVEDKSGKIVWKFKLEPKEEKKLDLKYNVRYPKGRTVNIR
ncbi:mucoidy inhibitor MuiA family protein [Owenweeksia hongkongensis]|uniref:mucoidy inhibitor MuiA family protein n=1 Tax=Owenweeksia hongkongensis TaxID=253245 RepID=UPI003A8DA138